MMPRRALSLCLFVFSYFLSVLSFLCVLSFLSFFHYPGALDISSEFAPYRSWIQLAERIMVLASEMG